MTTIKIFNLIIFIANILVVVFGMLKEEDIQRSDINAICGWLCAILYLLSDANVL